MDHPIEDRSIKSDQQIEMIGNGRNGKKSNGQQAQTKQKTRKC